MKKNYLFILLLTAFSMNAQFEINFDDMSAGDVSPQSPHIVVWPAAGVTDAQVTSEQAFSGSNSMLVRENGGGLVDDVLVNVGNQVVGTWTVTWMMFIPTNKVGFWNIQEYEDVSPFPRWNGQFFAGLTASGGSPGEVTFDQDVSAFVPYPENQWFSVTHVIDLDNSLHTVSIDGNLLIEDAPYFGFEAGGTNEGTSFQLGSVNFYAVDENNRYYIDDFKLIEGVLSTSDFQNQQFNVYPNPVVNQLNIQSKDVVNTVSVYNVLGKLVHQSSPNTISPSIDMGAYKSGIYFVEVTIGNSTKTVKVIK